MKPICGEVKPICGFSAAGQFNERGSTYHLVDLRILEDRETCSRSHRPIQDSIDWNSDQTLAVPRVGPFGRGGEDVIDEGEEVVEVTDGRVFA